MADGSVPITPGAGRLIAVDTVAGVDWQYTKQVFGPSGTTTEVTTAVGLPVQGTGTAGTPGGGVLTVQGVTSMTALKVDGSAVTQPVSAASLPLPTGAAADTSVNGILVAQGAALGSNKGPMILGSVTTAAPSYTTGQVSPLSLDVNGNLRVTSTASGTTTVSGTVTATQSGTWNIGTVTTVSAVTAITNALPAGTNTIGGVTLAANTTGGATPAKLISAASTNATSVKGSAGTLYSITAASTNASWRYLKLYDKATSPTVGTDTPIQVYPIPPNSSGDIFIPPCGLSFSLGIALAITGALADADTTAITAGDCVISYSTK